MIIDKFLILYFYVRNIYKRIEICIIIIIHYNNVKHEFIYFLKYSSVLCNTYIYIK